MAQKYWDHLKLKNGDNVHFVPPSPDGERLGGVTAAEKSKINTALQSVPSTYRTAAQQDAIHDSTKQNVISDLETIRSGASLGATALQTHQDISGKADLVDGKVPSSQLPSYVDDVIEANTLSDFPATGQTGKIYVATSTNLTYRWSGSAYVQISPSIALGETSSTAYRGDRGKTAYDHSQAAHAPSDAQKNVQSDWNATSGDAMILNKPTIPSEVTQSTVSGWGFTKNNGTYSKPSGGIPSTDLTSSVQLSLQKADSALQSYTQSDPVFSASAAASITSDDITNWNGKTSVTESTVSGWGFTKYIPKTYTISVPASGWSSSAPYTQIISQSGILQSDNPICDIDTSSATSSNIEDLLEAWGMIHNISTQDGSITVKCLTDKPTVGMSIIVKAV